MAAFASITPKSIEKVNAFTEEADFSAIATALASNGESTATYGAYFTMDDKDSKYLILVQNSAASGADKFVTIKQGNGIQGVKDLTKSDLGNGEYSLIHIESGRFKNVKENETLKTLSSSTAADRVSAKGKVFITGTSADIKVAVFKLPC